MPEARPLRDIRSDPVQGRKLDSEQLEERPAVHLPEVHREHADNEEPKV